MLVGQTWALCHPGRCASGSCSTSQGRPTNIAHQSWPLLPLPGAAAGAPFSHAAFVHCETTSGVLNDAVALGAAAGAHGASVIVDAMSAFGAIPLDVGACRADFVVSSANKCLQGVPGFSFVVARRAALEACKGRGRSLSLDLHAQWAGLESASGQFRWAGWGVTDARDLCTFTRSQHCTCQS